MAKESEWRVMSNIIGGRCKYIAYRIIDEGAPMHSGNIVYYGEYSEDRGAVERLAGELNAKEEMEDVRAEI